MNADRLADRTIDHAISLSDVRAERVVYALGGHDEPFTAWLVVHDVWAPSRWKGWHRPEWIESIV